MAQRSPSSGPNRSNTSKFVGRRSFLRTGAAVFAAGAYAGAAGASESYETIVADGQVFNIDDGETFENKLIDCTNGNAITIIARRSTDWTIRNIGFKGHVPKESVLIGASDTDEGTSTIENVYFGQGDPSASYDERGIMIYVGREHDGHLDVRNVNFSSYGKNGIYGSSPGAYGAGGTTHIDRCYAIDNHHTAYRLAAEGDKITNSVAKKSGDRNALRGIWIWGPGPVEVRDTHVSANGRGWALATYPGATAEGYNFQYDEEAGILEADDSTVTLDEESGTDPEGFVPEGCPTNAEMAAAGRSRGGRT